MWATSLSELAKERLAASAKMTDRAAKLASIRDVTPLYETARVEFDKAMVLDEKKADAYATNRLHFWVELYQQADARFKANDYEEALEIYKLTNVLDPKEPAGVFWMGYTLGRLDQTVEGVKLASQAKVMAEERIAELGDCSQFKSRARKNDCTKRIENYRTIQTNVDNFTKSKNVALGHVELDAALAEQDVEKKRTHFLTAIDYFDKGLAQDPSLTGVIFDKADALFKLGQTYNEGDVETAKKYYRQASGTFLQIADNDTLEAEPRKDARYNSIMALYAASDWADLLPQLKLYVDIDPRDQEVWRRMAKTTAELDRNLEAASNLMMSNAVGEDAETVAVNESVNTIKNLYGTSEAAQALGQLGEPEEVRAFREASEEGQVITTWIWWGKGEARHYVDGRQVGAVTFAPQSGEAHSSK
jgi:tetratricopeptide (TPR) repeat protein